MTKAVPGMRADLSSARVTAASATAPCLTSRGTPLAARTSAAAAESVTVTTWWPAG